MTEVDKSVKSVYTTRYYFDITYYVVLSIILLDNNTTVQLPKSSSLYKLNDILIPGFIWTHFQ